MSTKIITFLAISITLLSTHIFAGGSHQVGPFEMRGEAKKLEIQNGEISFEFTGQILAKDTNARMTMDYSVESIHISVQRAVGYEVNSPMGFSFSEEPEQAAACTKKYSNLRIIIPSPTMHFDQTKPTKISGSFGQFYGCFQN